MIPVTKPFLPPIEEYENFVKGVWERNWLTNNGPLSNELELQLKEYLNIPHLLWLSNGTIALQIAIKALELKGEIITTPFSFIATTSSIVWEGCIPVFADIHPDTFNLDPSKIEELITEETSAIAATHVYGNPCDIDAISQIAKKHKLKVIYDGAHAFGVKYKGKSVFEYGDITTTSFHATKLYHTIEGGAVFTTSPELLKKMAYMKNFGHYGPEQFAEIGINGKNSEFHAAMGLCNLKYIDSVLEKRKSDYNYYIESMKPLNLQYQKITFDSNHNYSYFPVLFDNEKILLAVFDALNGCEIFARRYFYPTLDNVPYLKKLAETKIPVARDISARVLCLPLYYTISHEEIDLISRIIQRTIKYCNL